MDTVSPVWRGAGIALAALLACLAVVAPVMAHNATEMGAPPDQYDQGIPVYWPYHAALMTIGFAALLSGFVVMRYHRTARWFENHRRLQEAGSIASVAGLAIGVYMVQLSAAPHVRELHGALGLGTIAVILGTLGLGIAMARNSGIGALAHQAHRWLGGAAIALVAVNITIGLAMMPEVLAR